jgi:hypothetical protein
MPGFYRTAANSLLRRVPPDYPCARSRPIRILSDILLRIIPDSPDNPDRRSAFVIDPVRRDSCARTQVPGPPHRPGEHDTFFPERHPALLHLTRR